MVFALLTSCSDFLDVQSKGQLTDDEMFTDLTGYEDAMFGIYGKLASSNLYGSNLSWGMVVSILVAVQIITNILCVVITELLA